MPNDAISQLAPPSANDGAELEKDRLEYLADHLLELQSLVGSVGGTTLNGLLVLAYQEARLQGRRLSGDKS